MKEKILKFERGPNFKKYTAYIQDKKTKKIRKIHFGDKRYQQYKDRTGKGLYSHKNHTRCLASSKISFKEKSYYLQPSQSIIVIHSLSYIFVSLFNGFNSFLFNLHA